MAVRLTRIPFADNLLFCLADDLLSTLDNAPDGDFSQALVILPSSRACKKLGQVLLERSGQNTLLLPRILTPAQLAAEVSVGLGLGNESLPDNKIRPIILAHHLKQMAWLLERPESAPGLAAEFIKFFDEARLYGKVELLLEGADMAAVLAMSSDAEAHIVESDLVRIQEVWQLYRQIICADEVDEVVALADLLRKGSIMPLASVQLVQVAGFARIDPKRQVLLESILNHGTEGVLYLSEISSNLSELFSATWDVGTSTTDPMAPSRGIAGQFGLADDMAPVPEATPSKSIRERIEALGLGLDLVHPQGPIQRQICGDSENESRYVAHRVVEILKNANGVSPHIAVAVNDANLANRISAQLRAAGIDSDSSHGAYLSSLPAGLLLRFILRSALMDLRSEPLLEVLAHPYVSLDLAGDSHGLWTLRLEKMFRGSGGPQGGLAAINRQAAHGDAAALRVFEKISPGMGKFVTAIADAFQPLVPFSDNKYHPWSEILSALIMVWNTLAGSTPLQENKDKSDVSAAARLFKVLQDHSAKLPPTTLAGFSSDFGRLLSAENVPPHRQGGLPVQILGMVEARLETFDYLILAGLREGSFPTKPERPIFMNGRLRQRLALPRWQDALARDAELFLRLLHNAPNVLLTWPKEDGGKPCLPSPFILRLDLCLGSRADDESSVRSIPLWRKQVVSLKNLKTAQALFAREPRIIKGHATSRPQTLLSWSGLRLWRDCPYSFHLQRGLALRPEEEVAEEFSRQENGTLIHAALKDFLKPNGQGWDALQKGKREVATVVLDAAAAAKFGPGSEELPVRLLWLKSFRQLIPAIIDLELKRAKQWKPVLLEERFELPLVDLDQWTRAMAVQEGVTLKMPPLAAHAQNIIIRGTIDRADSSLEESNTYSVLDYKTGRIPAGNDVKSLKDMQLQLYAIALECGAVNTMAPDASVKNGFFYSVTREGIGPLRKQLELEVADGQGRQLMIKAGEELIRLASEAGDPAAEFPLLPAVFDGDIGSHLPCRYCDYRGICRLEERDVGPVIGNMVDEMVNKKKVV